MTGNMIQNKRFSISKVKLTRGEAPNIFNNNHQKFCREEKRTLKIEKKSLKNSIYKSIFTIATRISECLPLT